MKRKEGIKREKLLMRTYFEHQKENEKYKRSLSVLDHLEQELTILKGDTERTNKCQNQVEI